jgi:cytochrome c nitrite reductase small subunit
MTTSVARQRDSQGSATLQLTLALLLGVLIGLGSYTLVYADALSYMSSDPKVCANCHIMGSQFDSWQKSSHHHVAGCNDCHLPRGFFERYLAKALNGFNHSRAYTLQNFDEPIAIKPFNSRIVQENCLACHRALLQEAVMARGPAEEAACVHCHSSAGHGERAGLGGPRT